MKPYQITLINGLALIILGLWGYFGSVNPSFTALIPVAAGTLLLLVVVPMKNINKTAAHLAAGLTLIILIALIKPLDGGISRNDTSAVIRVLIMMFTCTLALIVYIKSFVDARKQRSTLE